MIDLITLKNAKDLIKDVIVHPLKVNQDESGILTEVLKTDWVDVYGDALPFSQCYYSVTPSREIRDTEVWHVHPTKQVDRFICVRGDIVTAIYDNRPDSETNGRLNLFLMGESGGNDTQYLVLIPQNTLHGFAVVSQKEAVLLNFPTTLYDPDEEGRVSHKVALAKFNDGSEFNWDKVIAEVNLK